ncbi:glycosyltransferase family 2 protein [Hymenobacter sp. NST-14]|uniref:glycosyltransferase family 2 protein n=1 Tax=Hymenobacter piscis TaxID=2839984 RepID=UPI001C025C94|nr:glycosyltransferase family 2 protein [Hymenobacter piscis]MBT9393946.1 glycosyltransferase family 2 protein [Hymenobacter piscis]
MSAAPLLLSVVIPVYRAGSVLPVLLGRLHPVLAALTPAYEVVLVDDGSPDPADWPAIRQLAALDARVRGRRLSRNFGQHHALTAGLDASRGEWVVVMDCDLQDQPEEIPRLLARAQEGYEAVLARRGARTDSALVRGGSRAFYRVLAYLTGEPQDPAVGNFGIYHRRLIEALLQLRESTRYFPTMVRWAGFRQTSLPVAHGAGTRPSSYSLVRRLRLALDILLTYSDKPLRLAVYFGLLLSGGAFLLGLLMLGRYLLGQITVPGYASLMVSISLFSGIIIAVLGIVGLYVGKTFEGVRNRPLYVLAETTDPA